MKFFFLAETLLLALLALLIGVGRATSAPISAKQITGLGTAATKDVGTSAGQVPLLDGTGALPAVSGANLTNLPSGSMGGTAGTTDNALVRANGAGGTTLQASALVCDDSGNLSGVGNISLSGSVDGVDISVQAVLSSSSVTDNGIVRWDGATGLLVQNTSGPTIDDSGNIALAASATVDGVDVSTIPSTYQPLAANLTALGGLTSAAHKLPYFTGSGTAAVADYTTGAQAIDGLSYSAGTQVPALTGASTATLLTVGTAASNLVQLDSSANYPQAPFACAWTKTWSASDGSITSVGGFTLTNLSEGAAAQDSAGATYIPVSSTSAVGRVTYGSNLPTDASSWEVELDFIPATLDGSSGIQVDPGSGGTAERLFLATSWKNQAGTAWATQLVTNGAYRQTWTLVRHASAFTYAYLNGVPLGVFPFSSGSAGSTQRWCFGNCGATTVTRTYKIYRISIKAGGVCAFPPNMRPYGVVTGQ